MRDYRLQRGRRSDNTRKSELTCTRVRRTPCDTGNFDEHATVHMYCRRVLPLRAKRKGRNLKSKISLASSLYLHRVDLTSLVNKQTQQNYEQRSNEPFARTTRELFLRKRGGKKFEVSQSTSPSSRYLHRVIQYAAKQRVKRNEQAALGEAPSAERSSNGIARSSRKRSREARNCERVAGPLHGPLNGVRAR